MKKIIFAAMTAAALNANAMGPSQQADIVRFCGWASGFVPVALAKRAQGQTAEEQEIQNRQALGVVNEEMAAAHYIAIEYVYHHTQADLSQMSNDLQMMCYRGNGLIQ